MVFSRAVLIVTGVAFAGYGVACLIAPGMVAEFSGMEFPNASALTEAMAMYGGLQIGVGVLASLCGARVEYVKPGLFIVAILVGSLGTARLVGLVVHGATPYNLGAVFYELTTTACALVAIRLERGRAAASA